MGENRASGEGIGGFVGEEVRNVKDDHLSIVQNIGCLHSFYADKLKCVHSKSFRYNTCKINIQLETSLMIMCIDGEKNDD